jgi:predicted AlkP superfamily phosphohydrolase/phosphomutase
MYRKKSKKPRSIGFAPWAMSISDLLNSVLALIVGTALSGCADRENARGRVLLIGIDGATLRVIKPLIEQGKLSNLAALARDGVSSPLRSAEPMASPRIWTSIVTGKTPNKHGILSFAYPTANGKKKQLYLSSDRKAHALWNIASGAGLTVGVVNFWNTYPPEKIRGVMISDHFLASQIKGRSDLSQAADAPVGPIMFPEIWHERVASLLRHTQAITSVKDPFRESELLPRWAPREQLSRHFREDAALVLIAREIEAEIRPDLLMVLLTGVDRVSHVLWGTLEPPELYPKQLRARPAAREAGAAALRRYYEYTDALIGELIREFGPDDLVMVVSDHGFEAGVGMGLTGVHKSEKAIEGVFFARGPGIPANAADAKLTIRDVTPTVLAWLGLPIAEDMDGRPAAFLEVPEPERIASYDGPPIERLESTASDVEAEIVEQLRALGYFE